MIFTGLLSRVFWPIRLAHRGDFPDEMPGPAADFFAEKNDWEISETIPADDAEAANRLALTALEGGATALDFIFEKTSKPDFERLFDGIFLKMIGLHFSEKKQSADCGKFLAETSGLYFRQKIAY